MAKKKFAIDVGNAPNDRFSQITPGTVPSAKKWTFSLQYWRQIDNFGLDKSDAKWFVSLLEQFKKLSAYNVENVFKDMAGKKNFRLHDINWNQKNIPISLKKLDWLPTYVLENQEDFPIRQFQVSTALGRVVGFLDADKVFHVVLLDPKHNIQPAKKFDYRVDSCGVAECEYTTLLNKVDEFVKKNCRKKNCDSLEDLERIITERDKRLAFNVVLLKVSDEDKEFYDLLREEKKVHTPDDIFIAGLEALINTPEKSKELSCNN